MNRMRTVTLAAVVAGLGLAQQGCAANTAAPQDQAAQAPAAAPSAVTGSGASGAAASKTPAATKPGTKPATKPKGAPVLTGKRQFHLLPVGNEATLAVGAGNRVGLSDDFGDRALFVPMPTAPGSSKVLIKTGTLRKGGEAYCLEVTANGSRPLSVMATACDTRRVNQIFTFEPAGRTEGKTTYGIRTGGGIYFKLDPQGELDPKGAGLVAQELGDGPLDTTFILVDKGASTLPDMS
jgi:hypothetical protein